MIKLVPGGFAEADGVLRPGDKVVAVDGERLHARPSCASSARSADASLLGATRARRRCRCYCCRRADGRRAGCRAGAAAHRARASGGRRRAARRAAAEAEAEAGGRRAADAAGRCTADDTGRRCARRRAGRRGLGAASGSNADEGGAGGAAAARPAVEARASAGSGGGRRASAAGAAAGGRAERSGGAAEDWLLQKALEVSMLLRTRVASADALAASIVAAARLRAFMRETHDLAAELRVERDAVFQSLLGQLADGKSFDSQGFDGAVPMHQAKVLDRSERLREFDASLKAHVGGGRLPTLVGCADELRKVLRVKVEDGNDLLMADQTLDELNTFYQRLQAHAAETGEEVWPLYQRLL